MSKEELNVLYWIQAVCGIGMLLIVVALILLKLTGGL